MYIKLGDSTATVVGVSSSDIATTFAIMGQDGISTVLDNIGKEIRLYTDEACTALCAIYKADKVVRVSYEPDKRLVNLTVQATKVSEIEAEQMKEDIAHEKTSGNERDDALIELATLIEDNMNALTELGEMIESLDERVTALEPHDNEESEEEVNG